MAKLFQINKIIFILSFITSSYYCQETKKFSDFISINGYIKDMKVLSFTSLDSMMSDNLIHNRINFKAYINNKITTVLGIRNRIFYGEATGYNPYFASILDNDNGAVDLSFILIDKKNIVFHSILDRAYVKYSADKYEFTIGRQRINWGMNLAWTPNDIFNAYSLLDFDYQERVGVDAFKFKYFTKQMSSIELAASFTENIDSNIIAGIYKFNKWKYDFQVLSGNYFNDIAIGFGLDGNIKNAGFKSEFTYFHPKRNFIDTNGNISTSISYDYSFKNGIYFNTSYLYNSSGVSTSLSNNSPLQTIFLDISAKNIMPSKHSYFIQISGALNPKSTISFSSIYMQGVNLLLTMPSVSYSISDSWDLTLTGQSMIGKKNNNINGIGTGIFIRFMYSF